MKVKSLNWIPALLWALLIFYQSNQPSPAGADIAPDYLLHFGAYGILALLLANAMAGGPGFVWRGRPGEWGLFLTFVLTVIYGLSDEWHQSFIPGRDPSWADVAADFLGALVAVLILAAWRRTKVFRQ